MNDTLIVGAGPVGLFLAADLTLQGRTPLVIDRLAQPTGLSKALRVQGGGVALLEARGLAALIRAHESPRFADGLHFARIRLAEPASFLFVLQAHVEAVLEAHLASLGVQVQRGVELVGLEPAGDHIAARVRDQHGERLVEARYLVGCDGGRSAVRRLAGIGFPGTEPTMLLRLGDVRMPGAQVTDRGIVLGDGQPAPPGVGVPMGDDYFRVITSEPWTADVDRDAPFPLDELAASLRRTTGRDIPIADPRWLSRFTDASRQAATYRVGRVFVAGDAAHTHLPAGGPGLGTGLGDAANLGWRLAAVLGGHQPETWLDGYHQDRHPAGAQVLQHTRAQGALMARTDNVLALRELLTELLAVPEARRFIAQRVQGFDVRYGDDPDPRVGRWMPSPIDLRAARFVLQLPPGTPFENRWGARLDVGPGPQPLLVRPDGFVAWAGDGDATAAVARWLGTPLR